MKTSLTIHYKQKGAFSDFWLLENKAPVGYLRTVFDDEEYDTPVLFLHDIEIRQGYRGRGYSTELIHRAMRYLNVNRMVHRGDYTPLGFSCIAHQVEYIGEAPSHAKLAPMKFVEDWEKMDRVSLVGSLIYA